jgi:hypothetical protein
MSTVDGYCVADGVDAKVTTCPVNASRCTEINQGSMSTVDCDGVAEGVDPEVTSCHGNGSGCTEINKRSMLTVNQDGGVAEGVDAKDTTCHLNGSGCTEINDGSMWTVGGDDVVAEVVDSEVTTGHVNGSGCTEINMRSMTIIESSCECYGDSTPSLGYQHLYKSSNTSTSSRRVLASYRTMSKHIVSRGKNARKHEGRKMTKIRSLEQVLSLQAHSLEKEYLTRNAIFSVAHQTESFLNPVWNSIAQSVVNHLNVIDTVDGAQMVLCN